jgi:hypothetical protein
MWELLTSDPNRLRVALLYILPICLTILAVTAIKSWRMNEAHKRDHELKLEMLANGTPPDQVAHFHNATSPDTAPVQSRLAETLPYEKR